MAVGTERSSGEKLLSPTVEPIFYRCASLLRAQSLYPGRETLASNVYSIRLYTEYTRLVANMTG